MRELRVTSGKRTAKMRPATIVCLQMRVADPWPANGRRGFLEKRIVCWSTSPIMFTRFRSASGVHIMDVPLDVPSDIRESRFYGYLTSAYEYEVEYFASWLLRIAKEFKTALEQSDLKE